MTAPTARRPAGWLTAAALAAAAGVVTAQPAGGPDAARRRADALDLQVKVVGADARQLDARLAALRAELERLTEQAAKIPPGAPGGKKATAPAPVPVEIRPEPAPAAEKTAAKQVDFRLARGRVSSRESNVGFVCRERKVFIFDIRATARREQAFQQNSPVVKDGGILKVPSGDFDLKIETVRRPVGGGRVEVRFKQELTLRPGRAGETLDQARAAGSEYRKRLDALTPGENVLQFSVYSDSFDLFRELRQMAWGKEFDDIAWEPFSPVQTIGFGFGQIIAQ